MTSLEELLLKWHDGSLTAEELRALNGWLAQPEGRARLTAEFALDANLREVLLAQKTLATAQEQATAFQTIEVRQTDVFPNPRGRGWPAAVTHLWRLGHEVFGSARRGRFLLAGATSLLLIGALLFYSLTGETLARIEGNASGAIVLRGTKAVTAHAGLALRAEDRVKTSPEGAATVVYVKEATRIRLHPATHLRLDQPEDGKRLELIQGTITAKVAPQPKGQPMMVVTPQAEAKVLGTEFNLSAEASATRLEVTEGAVQLVNREDGRAVAVNGGFFATVGTGADDLVARSLLPNPWHSQDVGAVGLPGQARIDGQQCRVKAAGKNNCKTKDQFHFVYQTLKGDGEIRARVVDVELTHKLAKAGVVIRENLKSAAPHASLFLRAGSGLEFEHRPKVESKVDWISGETAPYWVRLVRQGDTITAYKSPDGARWTETGSDTFKMGRRIYIGLGVSSWNNSALTTSIFDNVSVIPAPPPAQPPN